MADGQTPPFIAMITSIRTKMLVLLGATVGITLTAFSVSIYLVMSTHLVERQKDILAQHAEERKEDLVYLFADRKKIFELLAMGDPVEVFARKYQEGVLVEHFRQHSDVFPVLSFSDFMGREALRIDRGHLDDKTRDLSVYDAFLRAVGNPGTVFHEALTRGAVGGPYFQIFFARRSYFDEDLGVIGAEMPLGVLTGRLGDTAAITAASWLCSTTRAACFSAPTKRKTPFIEGAVNQVTLLFWPGLPRLRRESLA